MEEIELASDYIVLKIPENSVEVAVIAKVWTGNEVQTVTRTLGMKEIKAAVKEAEAIYIPPDAMFVLTDVGKKYLEEHRAEMEDLWNEG